MTTSPPLAFRTPSRRLLALCSVLVAVLSASRATSSQAPPGSPWSVRPYARVLSAEIRELSGIARSNRQPNVYWVHNDSGDANRVFAIREDGTVLTPTGLTLTGARNVDWEDITVDGDTLYVADMGNNLNVRRDLGVYVVKEPDATQQSPLGGVTRLAVSYPDQAAFPPTDRFTFDCESIFVLRGRLFFITKHRNAQGRPAGDAQLYRLDTHHLDRVNTLTRVDRHPDLGGFVTSAAVSPDGRTLAVLALARRPVIWLFDTAAADDRMFQGAARRLVVRDMRQAEAITFRDNATLLVANEQSELYRVPVQQFSPVGRR